MKSGDPPLPWELMIPGPYFRRWAPFAKDQWSIAGTVPEFIVYRPWEIRFLHALGSIAKANIGGDAAIIQRLIFFSGWPVASKEANHDGNGQNRNDQG